MDPFPSLFVYAENIRDLTTVSYAIGITDDFDRIRCKMGDNAEFLVEQDIAVTDNYIGHS